MKYVVIRISETSLGDDIKTNRGYEAIVNKTIYSDINKAYEARNDYIQQCNGQYEYIVEDEK